MKKVYVFLFTIVVAMVFTACSGEKKGKAPATEPVKIEKAEVVVAEPEKPAEPTLPPAEMLKNFQAYAKEYATAFNNISKNPKKFSELAGQSQKKVAEMEKIKTELNTRQSQEYQKALDMVLKVNRGGK